MNAAQTFIRGKRQLYCFAETPSMCRQLLQAGVRIIQLRDKTSPDAVLQNTAGEMMDIMGDYNGALLILNDRPGLAVRTGAHGVHLGQDTDFRALIPDLPEGMITGVSVDTVAEALEAEEAGATYVGAGAAFPTATKPDAVLIGTGEIRRIVQAVSIPVVAIGGIDENNISSVVRTGARYFAVISAVNSHRNVRERVRYLTEIIESHTAA